jgi:hypothetical protein
MALVLARFLYGFSLSLIVVAVLIAATLLCIRLVGIAVVAFDEERSGNIAGAACVAAIVVGALVAMVWLGHRLYDALGASALVGGTAHWLAGGNTLSPAAIFGTLAGFGLLASLLGWINRPAPDPEAARAKADAKASVKPAKGKAAEAMSVRKPKTTSASARKSVAAARGPRIPQLGWLALFLLLLGGAVFAFGFGVDPIWVPADTAPAAARHYQDMAARARPVYLVAVTLLGAGGVLALIWFFWRGKLDD